MHCQHCEARTVYRIPGRRRSLRRRTATCERCGAAIPPSVAPGPVTGAELTRFGLAITGDPLLELKPEGV